MAADPPASAWKRRLKRSTERARQAAETLKREFDAGREGDPETLDPPAVLWDRPSFDSLRALIRSSRRPGPDAGERDGVSPDATGPPGGAPRADRGDDVPPRHEDGSATGSAESAASPAHDPAADGDSGGNGDAEVVAGVLARVDWPKVSDSVGSRTSEVAERLQALAAEVDWQRMRPVAGKVATALVAAAATGQLGRLSGPAAQAVARAINGDQGVGEAAASLLARRPGGAAAAGVMQAFLADHPAWKAPQAGTAAPPPSARRSTPGERGGEVVVGDVEVIAPGDFEARLAALRRISTGG